MDITPDQWKLIFQVSTGLWLVRIFWLGLKAELGGLFASPKPANAPPADAHAAHDPMSANVAQLPDGTWMHREFDKSGKATGGWFVCDDPTRPGPRVVMPMTAAKR